MRHARAVCLAVAVTAAVTACTDQGEGLEGSEREPLWRGELVVTIVDSPSGSQRLYGLRTASGQHRRLLLADEPDAPPGTPIRVWGPEENGAVRVSRLEAEGPISVARRA